MDEEPKRKILVVGAGSIGPGIVKLLRLRGYDDVSVVERNAIASLARNEKTYPTRPPRQLNGKHKVRPGRRG